MTEHPAPDTPTDVRHPRRGMAAAVAVALVAGLFANPLISHAGLDLPFSDVPETHPFFEEIRHMYAAGVVEGFPDGTYKPTAPVSRQTMAAYLSRFAGLLPDVAFDSRTDSFQANATAWTTVPGLSATISVPDGIDLDAEVIARVTGESACWNASGWLGVRLLLDGVEMGPAGTDLAFDGSDNNEESIFSYESHAMERYSIVGSGPHTVTVQMQVSNAGVICSLDDATLSVESFPLL